MPKVQSSYLSTGPGQGNHFLCPSVLMWNAESINRMRSSRLLSTYNAHMWDGTYELCRKKSHDWLMSTTAIETESRDICSPYMLYLSDSYNSCPVPFPLEHVDCNGQCIFFRISGGSHIIRQGHTLKFIILVKLTDMNILRFSDILNVYIQFIGITPQKESPVLWTSA